jgi:DNA polymerase III epsilon subunit-like protein
MTTGKKPRGYIEKALFIDCETSGLAYNCDDPSYDPATGQKFQAVSFGLIVVNMNTLRVVEKLYVEIKWDGESVWDKRAQSVHGLSLEYLEDNGLSPEDAVVEIATLIINHWGPDGVVCLGGHNVATFDKWFLQRLLRSQGINIRFGSKTIDTNAIGLATFGTHNSDDLFEAVGLPTRDPERHNALTDAMNCVEVIRVVRSVFNQCLE